MKFEQYKFLKKQLLSNAVQDKKTKKELQPAPLVLAYLGDSLFSLYVRQRLVELERSKVRVLNDVGAALVSAVMQSQALDEMQALLTEQEADIVRRGRNTKSAVPKSASMQEYRKSTGFECLLGWLYWHEKRARLDFLMEKTFSFLVGQLLEKEIGDKT